MDKKRLRGIKPAPFPNSAHSEQLSADIFHKLLDRKCIRGNVTVMDKMPNIDGILYLIDEQQYPVGQFEVQLKTLSSRYRKNPRFQCELSLLAYALESMLPVILVVVDQQAEKAYWLHLDEALVDKLKIRDDANSVILPLSAAQVLDGKDIAYVSAWRSIVDALRFKLSYFDELKQQRDAFKLLLGGKNPRLLPAYNLNELAIREIHIFLDLLNSKFDHEFRSIKETLYYHYWKMAIAIRTYQADELAFLVLPLPLSSNSPLILEIADRSRPSLDELFAKDKALIMMHTNGNQIKTQPKILAMELVAREVFRVVGKRHFPTADRLLAEEYVYGFADRFASLLGLSRRPDKVEVAHVLRTIFVLVPLIRDVLYGSSNEHITFYIDHFMAFRDAEFAKLIKKTENALADGMIVSPNLKIALQTRLFDLDLLRFYLEFLESIGVKSVERPLLEMKDGSSQGGWVWSCWNLEHIYLNLTKVMESFPSLYQRIVEERFPLLKSELDLYQQYSVILYILVSGKADDKPQLYYYRFMAIDAQPLRQLLFFHWDDPACPLSMDEDDNGLIWRKQYDFSGVKHELRSTGGLPLEFLMASSPMHRLIGDTLGNYLDKYFKAQGLKKTDYKRMSAYD